LPNGRSDWRSSPPAAKSSRFYRRGSVKSRPYRGEIATSFERSANLTDSNLNGAPGTEFKPPAGAISQHQPGKTDDGWAGHLMVLSPI